MQNFLGEKINGATFRYDLQDHKSKQIMNEHVNLVCYVNINYYLMIRTYTAAIISFKIMYNNVNYIIFVVQSISVNIYGEYTYEQFERAPVFAWGKPNTWLLSCVNKAVSDNI